MGTVEDRNTSAARARSIDFDGAFGRGVFHVEHWRRDPGPVLVQRPNASNEPQNVCYLLHTNDRVHELVRRTSESPLYNGQIAGIGPRYCPSLEDKVMRFPDRERHQTVPRARRLDVEEIYVNGFSMSLPARRNSN